MSVARDRDGFYHPATEDELAWLVQQAHRRRLKLRVRGAAHSVSHAIYTDPLYGVANSVNQQQPPRNASINVMLDRYDGWWVKSEAGMLVEAQAGIHLGPDPSNPTGAVPPAASLLKQLWDQQGWTLSDVGGITHQTVSGFTATGSAGGSLRYSANQNVRALRVIDGTGRIYEVSVDDDSDVFHSMVPNLGLLGVVSTITFKCVDAFNIIGQEAISKPADCSIDLFGPGDAERPSLGLFLSETEYARVEWWPQRGAERVLVWQAAQIPRAPELVRRPYREFGKLPTAEQLLGSIVFTVLGNLDGLAAVSPALRSDLEDLDAALADRLAELAAPLGRVGISFARFFSAVVSHGTDQAIEEVLSHEAPLIKRDLPKFFPELLGIFVKPDAKKHWRGRGIPQFFTDHAWSGLPMDNEASDRLLPMEFTELWIPLGHTQQAMEVLRHYFASAPSDAEAYERTGTNAWELYSEMPSRFWLNPAYSDGIDEWRDGAFRIDVYWFVRNAADPTEFFRQFWNLLRAKGIPVRLHWGKFLPRVERDPEWVGHLQSEYRMWDAFMSERRRRDPRNIFLTDYWREHLGLPG